MLNNVDAHVAVAGDVRVNYLCEEPDNRRYHWITERKMSVEFFMMRSKLQAGITMMES